MRPLPSILRSERGAAAAEFALVLPITLLLLLGMIDVGRFMYILNRAEKATQIGARMAAVTDPVSPGLIDADYASSTLPAGSLIPADRLGTLLCTSNGCECEADPCPSGAGVDSAALGRLAVRMNDILDGIGEANVEVRYSGSGFGYAGNPTGSSGGTGGGGGGSGAVEAMEISPLITVSVTDLEFAPIFLAGLIGFELPPFSSSLPAEDSSGQVSN